MQLLQTIKYFFIGLAVLSGYNPQPVEQNIIQDIPTPYLGVNIAACADFTTALSGGISSSATSMVIDSLSCGGSQVLAPGETYGFKLGGQEYVIGTVSTTTANTITMMTRGLSRLTATSSITALTQIWGRGTSVEQTDAPILLNISNKVRGAQGFDSPIKYVSETTVSTSSLASDRNNIASAGLVADTAFNGAGVISATTLARGVVQIATGLEQASSTVTGSSGTLAIGAQNATSSCNSTTSALKALITSNSGKINSTCIDSSAFVTIAGNNTYTGVNTFSTSTTATTTIGGFPAWAIGKQSKIYTSTGTFTVPIGITIIHYKMVGGGGGGAQGAGTAYGSGGSAAGFAEGWIDTTATTSIGVTIGALGTGHTGSQGVGVSGTATVFGTIICNGGSGGSDTGNVAGGSCTGGSINIQGQGSQASIAGAPSFGGSSPLGFGGYSGAVATGYGAGGGPGTGASTNAGNGTPGILILNW